MEKFFNTAGPVKPDIRYSFRKTGDRNRKGSGADRCLYGTRRRRTEGSPQIIFDRTSRKSWDKKLYCLTRDYNGRHCTICGV